MYSVRRLLAFMKSHYDLKPTYYAMWTLNTTFGA